MRTQVAAVAAGLLVLAASAVAQPCSDLTITGSVNPGNTVTLSVTGAPAGSLTLLGLGESGTTTIGAGLFAFTIDLAWPFHILPLGMTDANGEVSVSIEIPSNIPQGVIPSMTLDAQAATFGLSLPTPANPGPPSFGVCVSDVESLVFGS